jgi:hypothetical protein
MVLRIYWRLGWNCCESRGEVFQWHGDMSSGERVAVVGLFNIAQSAKWVKVWRKYDRITRIVCYR